MASFTDQTGRKILLAEAPVRIISTVPSQTELLYDLGLGDNVVGITAYCVHPPDWLQEKVIIGGTKNLQLEKIKALKPDLIIGNKEENIKEQIEELASEFPVWLSDVKTLEDAVEMIDTVGKMCQKEAEADQLNREIKHWREKIRSEKRPSKTAAYFIWKDPFMLAGPDTFINAMLQEAGFKNVIEQSGPRYPQVVLDELKQLDPDVILLSSEPYPFNSADLHTMADFFPNSGHKVVDGELFSWYGSRIIRALKYFYNGF